MPDYQLLFCFVIFLFLKKTGNSKHNLFHLIINDDNFSAFNYQNVLNDYSISTLCLAGRMRVHLVFKQLRVQSSGPATSFRGDWS